jgi:signal transduction histidine kinase
LRIRTDKDIKLKWQVFFYLCIFAAVVLVLLWLFQMVFLENFYEQIKRGEVMRSAERIARSIDDVPRFADTLEEMVRQGITVRIMRTELIDHGGGDILYAVDPLYRSNIIYAVRDTAAYSEMVEYTRLQGGQTVFPFNISKTDIEQIIQSRPDLASWRRGEGMQSMILMRIADSETYGEVAIVLHSVLSPVSATVDTLRVQLTIITILLVVLSIVVALIISRRISGPIAKINDSACQLALGDYGVSFDAGGYQEIGQLSETLNYAASELSKVENLRRELIANISHDLRTPLTLISGYGEMMRDMPGERTPENIQVIVEEAQRLSTLVSDLMDVSKYQSGVQTLKCGQFNFTRMVRELLKRYGRLVEREGYQIQFVAAEDITVSGDATRLGQVVYNLVNNAVNYTGEDKTVLVRQFLAEDALRLEITDSGPGIAPEDIPYIWDRYYKVDKSHKRAVISSGLGLSIVKEILVMHDANFGVESRQGQGSTFWFELPL